MADIATNRQARHRYHFLETWEAGLVLTGTEVKSLREGKAQIKDGYAITRKSDITTKESFGDCQIHVEFATPEKIEGSGQGRGTRRWKFNSCSQRIVVR